jgi:hypothetical protein
VPRLCHHDRAKSRSGLTSFSFASRARRPVRYRERTSPSFTRFCPLPQVNSDRLYFTAMTSVDWLLLAEGHLHRRLFGQMLRRMDLLSVPSG